MMEIIFIFIIKEEENVLWNFLFRSRIFWGALFDPPPLAAHWRHMPLLSRKSPFSAMISILIIKLQNVHEIITFLGLTKYLTGGSSSGTTIEIPFVPGTANLNLVGGLCPPISIHFRGKNLEILTYLVLKGQKSL